MKNKRYKTRKSTGRNIEDQIERAVNRALSEKMRYQNWNIESSIMHSSNQTTRSAMNKFIGHAATDYLPKVFENNAFGRTAKQIMSKMFSSFFIK